MTAGILSISPPKIERDTVQSGTLGNRYLFIQLQKSQIEVENIEKKPNSLDESSLYWTFPITFLDITKFKAAI